MRSTIRKDRQSDAARRTGIDQATLSRWLGDGAHDPSAVRAIQFARAYGVNPIQALVAAGLLTRKEANMPPGPEPVDLTEVPVSDLARELARRTSDEDVA